jgi:hypothetical protein
MMQYTTFDVRCTTNDVHYMAYDMRAQCVLTTYGKRRLYSVGRTAHGVSCTTYVVGCIVYVHVNRIQHTVHAYGVRNTCIQCICVQHNAISFSKKN